MITYFLDADSWARSTRHQEIQLKRIIDESGKIGGDFYNLIEEILLNKLKRLFRQSVKKKFSFLLRDLKFNSIRPDNSNYNFNENDLYVIDEERNRAAHNLRFVPNINDDFLVKHTSTMPLYFVVLATKKYKIYSLHDTVYQKLSIDDEAINYLKEEIKFETET